MESSSARVTSVKSTNQFVVSDTRTHRWDPMHTWVGQKKVRRIFPTPSVEAGAMSGSRSEDMYGGGREGVALAAWLHRGREKGRDR